MEHYAARLLMHRIFRAIWLAAAERATVSMAVSARRMWMVTALRPLTLSSPSLRRVFSLDIVRSTEERLRLRRLGAEALPPCLLGLRGVKLRFVEAPCGIP